MTIIGQYSLGDAILIKPFFIDFCHRLSPKVTQAQKMPEQSGNSHRQPQTGRPVDLRVETDRQNRDAWAYWVPVFDTDNSGYHFPLGQPLLSLSQRLDLLG